MGAFPPATLGEAGSLVKRFRGTRSLAGLSEIRHTLSPMSSRFVRPEMPNLPCSSEARSWLAPGLVANERRTLNNLVNGKSGISADMAIRLDKAFGGGAETWLRLQMAYDLAQARRREGDFDVKPVARRKLHEPPP
jgi:addiction module HigA family antidote